MPSQFGITRLIPGLVNEVALEIFRHFVTIDPGGPSTLVLVCTAWRDAALRSRSLESLRRDRRRPNPALIEKRDKVEEGICIVSFDGGGPGSMSQLRILEEFMARLASETKTNLERLRPADFFDLMGGVGFGGLVAILLGRLRMTIAQAMEELATIGTETFPECADLITPAVTMARLRNAIERMLERNGHSVNIKLFDSSANRCKVVLFAATTAVMDHCHPFRSYESPRRSLEYLVDALCATMAAPEYFAAVDVGRWFRRRKFAGIPHNLDNPMREVLKEARLIFGERSPVSLVLSLGAGQKPRHSSPTHHATRRCHYDGVARDLQDQLNGIGEYLRLNVDKGMEQIQLDNWGDLGAIETYTDVYLEIKRITDYIDRAAHWLLQRNGSVKLAQLCGTSTDHGVKVHSETLMDYLTMEFKQMHDVVQQCGIAKITLVDVIGNDIPIPMQFCATYELLAGLIGLFFKHQRLPGCEFVERGDYRLIHGDLRNTVGPMEWDRVKKVGLTVEMSVVFRTRNEDKARCPSCRTLFEGSTINGWAQCLSCSRQFQTENQIDDQPDDMDQTDDNPPVEPSGISPAMKESQNRDPPSSKRTGSGHARILQFRLISVINLLECLPPDSPTIGGPELTDDTSTEALVTLGTLGASPPEFLLLPVPLTLLSNDQDPSSSDSIKLSDGEMEAINSILLQCLWYTDSDEEPSIEPDDPFVTQDLILATDKSRFSAFIYSNSSGRRFCRIRHDIPRKSQLIGCTFSALHAKDAIAHVCQYLNYAPYKCGGIGEHPACNARYSTRERRNDHYAKMKNNSDIRLTCERCGVSLLARNLLRHIGTCQNTNGLEKKPPTQVGMIH